MIICFLENRVTSSQINFILLESQSNESHFWRLGHGFFIIRFTDPPTVYFGVLEKK